MSSGGGLYVQYGCGLCAPDGWLNFDASPRLKLERTPVLRFVLRHTAGLLFPANARHVDIVDGLPVADGAARGVYCSHVLEHLRRDELPIALRNTYRMLSPGGLFRLVMPDLHWRMLRYAQAAEHGDPAAADALMSACSLGTRTKRTTMMAALREKLSRNEHLWMYDFAALAALLAQAGFDRIRRCEFADCSDSRFALVEDNERFFSFGERELAIEAARPSGA
jgi:predicted SAM-dependent methyltransferase